MKTLTMVLGILCLNTLTFAQKIELTINTSNMSGVMEMQNPENIDRFGSLKAGSTPGQFADVIYDSKTNRYWIIDGLRGNNLPKSHQAKKHCEDLSLVLVNSQKESFKVDTLRIATLQDLNELNSDSANCGNVSGGRWTYGCNTFILHGSGRDTHNTIYAINTNDNNLPVVLYNIAKDSNQSLSNPSIGEKNGLHYSTVCIAEGNTLKQI